MIVAAEAATRVIRFEVTTVLPLPAGEQIFITGNRAAFGNWRPDGLPLSRMDENLWTASVVLPDQAEVEFKITRGSWASEQANPDGTALVNHRVEEGGDRAVRVQVYDWGDHRPGPAPRITGSYRVHDSVGSTCLRHSRKIIVWLPPSYAAEPARRYPVLYMHDGQQVFDPLTSTWNQDWEVDEWCSRLMERGALQEIIVVAIYSTEDRFIEYNPTALGSSYARFMLEELKPMIDGEYRTLAGRESTAVAGSSMGGAISLYLAWTHPDVFFGAACLSPAVRLADDQYCLDMVRHAKQKPDLRLYVYCGEGDDLERRLMDGTRELAQLLQRAGFRSGQNLQVVEDAEGSHNEASWCRHTGEWLPFLFGNR